jgi:hypothetical protein
MTYDPILEVRDLPRYRVLRPVAPPQLGTALVLEQKDGAPLVIQAGDGVPEARLGHYRRAFVVDLGQYGLQLDEMLTSADPSFVFNCSVTFSCRVRDPALVVAHNIRDMTAAVRLPIVRIMHSVAHHYDISQFNQAQAALNHALGAYTGDAAIQLGSYLVELHVGGGAPTSSAEYHDVAREARLDGIRRSEMSDVVARGRDELIAQWLIRNGGDPSALFAAETEAKHRESENLLAAMSILSSSDTDAEPFDTKEERRRLFGRFLDDHGGMAADDRPRRRRLSGSLASRPPEPVADGRSEGGPAGKAEAKTEEKPADSPSPEERKSRVRGVQQQGPPKSSGRGARLRDPDADGR